MKKSKIITFVCLQILIAIYSISGVLSKLAAKAEFMSLTFILCYGGVIFILGIYALGWQQIIKRLPLTTAFANKALTVAWGLVWGLFFFEEQITIGKLIGAALVIFGVVIYAKAGDKNES